MITHPSTVNRRRFLQTTAAAGFATPFLLRSSLRAASPNGKLSHACIGVGGMGWGDLQNFQQHPRTQIVALCDVDANNLNFKDYPRPKLKDRNHYHHFADACLGGEKTESHFAQSGPMTEAILLGTVAIRVPDQKLEWDAQRMKFPNHPEAERFLRRRYREGWEVKLV